MRVHLAWWHVSMGALKLVKLHLSCNPHRRGSSRQGWSLRLAWGDRMFQECTKQLLFIRKQELSKVAYNCQKWPTAKSDLLYA